MSCERAAPSAGAEARPVARAGFWVAGGYGAKLSIRLGSNLVLARILSPEIFGLMALVHATLIGLAMFSDLGLAQSIVQSPRGEERDYLRTVWTLQALRGAVLWGLCCALAWPVARIYSEPAILWLLPVAGLSVLIAGFNSTALPRLARRLEIGWVTTLEVATQAVASVVTLALAIARPSVWALVLGGLLGGLLKLALSHRLPGGGRDRFGWSPAAWREIASFGSWIFLSTVLTFLAGQADRLLLGHLVPLGVLGLYSIAASLALMPAELIVQLSAGVLFPSYSRILRRDAAPRDSRDRMGLALLAAGSLPIAVLFAAPEPLIAFLYDPRYAAAAWMLRILSVSAWLAILGAPKGAALLASGRTRALALSNAAKFAALLVLMPMGYSWLGLPGAIAGLALAEAFRYAGLAWSAEGAGVRSLAADAVLSAAAAGLALIGWIAGSLVARLGGSPVESLLASGGACGLVWLMAAAMVLARSDALCWVDVVGFTTRPGPRGAG